MDKTTSYEPQCRRSYPTGRLDVVPSAVTGLPLRYFTPDPLPVLMERCRRWTRENDVGLPIEFAFVLVGAASWSKPHATIDRAQAARMLQTVLVAEQLSTSASLVALGKQISPRNIGLRQEIVFSGGTNASNARHVYAPHNVLPQLIEALPRELAAIPPEISPQVAAALAGYYCAHLHPFIDGNGRWSRVVAIEAARGRGNPSAGMLSAAFLNIARDELAGRVWPATRTSGFEAYLILQQEFQQRLLEGLSSPLIEATRQVLALLRRYSPTNSSFESIAIQAFSGSELRLPNIRARLGLSTKRAEGFWAALEDIAHGFDPGVSAESLVICISETAARECVRANASIWESLQ